MRSGFNTNVRHRGTVFHIQTEDSGRAHPHLVTHLFYEGTILASEKQSYAERAEEEDLGETVKRLMEIQHLGLLERLRSGGLDDEITTRLGAEIFCEPGGVAEPEGGDTETDLSTTGAPPEDVAEQGARRRPSRPPADASLDELVLDYLAERSSRSPDAR